MDLGRLIDYVKCQQEHHRKKSFEDEYKNLLIEFDGEQHFRQVSDWKSPEEQNKTDKFKISKCLENGYSIIHILQEDVWFDKNNWKELLFKEITKRDIPELILIGENNDLHIVFS